MAPIRFENSYAALPERFYARVHPEQAPRPELIRLNEPLAARFGLDIDWLKSADGVAMLSGVRLPESSEPIAMAYAGHQFGSLVPQLGDGRAHLIGELLDRDGLRFDVHLKGSGRTPFSRRGDGKAALGPVLREYIVSEAFAALGSPGTRSLAAVLTVDVQANLRYPMGDPGAAAFWLGAASVVPGSQVVVRGKVVKLSKNIMDKNWLHIEDGSGASGANSLVVLTTDDNAAIGDVVTATGTITPDKDFGYGYKYDVIMEQADIKK